MKASELIKKLENIIEESGDLELCFEAKGFNAEEYHVIDDAFAGDVWLNEENDEGFEETEDGPLHMIVLSGHSIGICG